MLDSALFVPLYSFSMNDEPARDLFPESSALFGLAADERRVLLGLLRPRRYRRDEVVCHQGDPGDTLHVIRRGRLKVQISGEGGEEAVLTVIGPGELFGELSLLDGAPRSATIVALEEVETATLGRADFMALLRRSPDLAESLLAALARMIRRLSDNVTDLMFLDLRGRLAKKLLELASAHGQPASGAIEIGVPLTQEELAGMIGTTRPRVNQALGFFEEQGAIARRGRRIAVLDPDALRWWIAG